jgi:hypothetical protein
VTLGVSDGVNVLLAVAVAVYVLVAVADGVNV